MLRRTGWAPLVALRIGSGAGALLGGIAVLLAAGAARGEAPFPALEDAVARSVLDAEVLRAIEAEGRARIVAVFERVPGTPGRLPLDTALARMAGRDFEGRRFDAFRALAGSADAAALAALVADPQLARVSLDRRVTAQLAESVPLVELDKVQQKGFTGSGVEVAIVDTGVDVSHPDLAGSVVAEHCFCTDGQPGPFGCCPNGMDEMGGAGSAQDDHGHGTNVAGIVTSAGVHAPVGGAPDAALIALKVLDATGNGFASDVLAGLDWILVNRAGAAAVNLSLGFGLYPGDCDGADANTIAFAEAIDQLHAAEILTVAGSGNAGSGTGMIAPACIARAVSVGAVWDADVGSQSAFGCTDATTVADQVTCWSNSSSTTDVFAPGGRVTTSQLGGTTQTKSGTSFATPMVTACAAALRQAHPQTGVDAVAAALTASPVYVLDATNGLAFPRLDCLWADLVLTPPEVPAQPGGFRIGLALLLAGAGAVLLRQRRGRLP